MSGEDTIRASSYTGNYDSRNSSDWVIHESRRNVQNILMGNFKGNLMLKKGYRQFSNNILFTDYVQIIYKFIQVFTRIYKYLQVFTSGSTRNWLKFVCTIRVKMKQSSLGSMGEAQWLWFFRFQRIFTSIYTLYRGG